MVALEFSSSIVESLSVHKHMIGSPLWTACFKFIITCISAIGMGWEVARDGRDWDFPIDM